MKVCGSWPSYHDTNSVKQHLVSQEAGCRWPLSHTPRYQFYHAPNSSQTFSFLNLDKGNKRLCKLEMIKDFPSSNNVNWSFIAKEIWLKLCKKIINLFTFFSFEKKYLNLRWRLESTFIFILELTSFVKSGHTVKFTKSLINMPPKNNPSPNKSNSRSIWILLLLPPKFHLQICLYFHKN